MPREVDVMSDPISQYFKDFNIQEVEAIVPDMAGIARGKLMPAEKFQGDRGMRLPESIFLQTVTGDYPEDTAQAMSPAEIDIILKPDPRTVRRVPWAAEPTAQVIHDCFYADGRRVKMAPREVLKHVLDLYAQRGWEPVVAPELEFYLVEPNVDADYPLKPPMGRSGRSEPGRQSYSIAAVNEFDPLFDDLYQFCEAQDIAIDTLIHEDGPAQMEINLLHGNALDLADQAFMFKRTAREAALRHKMYATFMAKPHAKEPGSAMHLHQSVVDKKTGKNVFSADDGTPTPLFFAHLAGLQRYLPAAMALFAPNVNSYRRITRFQVAPINVQWGYDNRTAGLRVPMSEPQSRRVENRISGADANPYLATAASLACGYLGMVQGLSPTEPISGSAHDLPFSLPRNLDEAIRLLRECDPLIEILGDSFVSAFALVKEAEYEVFLQVISSWEREHLLLNV
jgi:glutamine synthetase